MPSPILVPMLQRQILGFGQTKKDPAKMREREKEKGGQGGREKQGGSARVGRRRWQRKILVGLFKI
ncbi:unnamed protein product [Prunus armeniaca]|uniref:Uncharacterized protein n=1 Tax=Prunus armeniaca TaxID=36596 RepID=A0A6J5VAR6_PRUAR|nr:unnamed protein product [Prunus armeniaca]